jgi:predicted Zn-dependent protease with MMP-like domain
VTDPIWAQLRSPSLEDFEIMAAEAFARLPESFRARCADLVIKVEDFPDEDVLDDLDADTPYDILGLYQGISLAGRDSAPPVGPDMVFLYRRPMLDFWAEFEDTLGHIVTHVLVHEIGHHFGLSDADMETIEAAAGHEETVASKPAA